MQGNMTHRRGRRKRWTSTGRRRWRRRRLRVIWHREGLVGCKRWLVRKWDSIQAKVETIIKKQQLNTTHRRGRRRRWASAGRCRGRIRRRGRRLLQDAREQQKHEKVSTRRQIPRAFQRIATAYKDMTPKYYSPRMWEKTRGLR